MTSPETLPPAPQGSVFAVGDGSWKAILPLVTVLGVFLAALVGMLAYFDNRFTVGIAGFRTELAMMEQRLTAQLAEVKKDLSERIDRMETELGARIDRMEAELGARIDRTEAEPGARIDRTEAEPGARIDRTEAEPGARIDRTEAEPGARIDRVEKRMTDRIDEVKAELAAGEARRAAVDAQLSADIERATVGVAENRAARRELAGFVRANRPPEPSPETAEPGTAPAQ